MENLSNDELEPSSYKSDNETESDSESDNGKFVKI